MDGGVSQFSSSCSTSTTANPSMVLPSKTAAFVPCHAAPGRTQLRAVQKLSEGPYVETETYPKEMEMSAAVPFLRHLAAFGSIWQHLAAIRNTSQDSTRHLIQTTKR